MVDSSAVALHPYETLHVEAQEVLAPEARHSVEQLVAVLVVQASSSGSQGSLLGQGLLGSVGSHRSGSMPLGQFARHGQSQKSPVQRVPIPTLPQPGTTHGVAVDGAEVQVMVEA